MLPLIFLPQISCRYPVAQRSARAVETKIYAMMDGDEGKSVWVRRGLIAAIVLVASAACGANSAVPAPVDDPNELTGNGEDRPTSVESTDTTGTSQAIPEPADSLQAEPEYLCSEPTTPLESVEIYPRPDPPMVELGGTKTFVSAMSALAMDSDGDGLPDTIVPGIPFEDPLQIIRGNGTLRLDLPERYVSARSLGDIDADGMDEIEVRVQRETTSSGNGSDPEDYLIPGGTSSGAHDPAKIGIQIPGSLAPVGDRDRDGIQDLVSVTIEDQTTFLYSGASFLAEGIGADGRSVTPLLVLPGVALGHGDVGQDAPAIIIGGGPGADSETGVLSMVDERGIRLFSTAGFPWVAGMSTPYSMVDVIETDSGLFLELDNSARSGSRVYRWRIDSPCPG